MSGSTTVTASDAVSPHRSRLRWSGDVNLGHALQAGMLGLGLIIWLVTGQSKTETLAGSVQSLQGQVASQNQDTRTRVDEGFRRVEATLGAVQSQVLSLPDLAARLRTLEDLAKRLEDRDTQLTRYLDERRGLLDQRFQTLETRAMEGVADRRELRSAIEHLQRASGVNLPGSRGAR